MQNYATKNVVFEGCVPLSSILYRIGISICTFKTNMQMPKVPSLELTCIWSQSNKIYSS